MDCPLKIAEYLFNIVLTIVSVAAGFILATLYERSQSEKAFKARRTELLTDLKTSLQENLRLLNQITDLHFPKGELPSFTLDTALLHFVSANVRQFIPSHVNLREEYNKLRFELEHINTKFEILRMYDAVASSTLPLIDGLLSSNETDNAWRSILLNWRNSILLQGRALGSSVAGHISQAKEWLGSHIDRLEKLI